MRIPNEVQLAQPWRIHSVVADFRLEDVWALPALCGARDDFGRVVELATRSDPAKGSSVPTRFLWGVRDRLGQWCDLGRISDAAKSDDERLPIPGTREFSLVDRLPDDLRGSAEGVQFLHLPFVPLYRCDREFAAEVSNQTVHGVMHLAWVRPDGEGSHEALPRADGRLRETARPTRSGVHGVHQAVSILDRLSGTRASTDTCLAPGGGPIRLATRQRLARAGARSGRRDLPIVGPPYHGPVTSVVATDAAGVRDSAQDAARQRTYEVRTYGCQMNVHDSERLAGLLEAAGYRRAAAGTDADVVVFNTCAVRENADNKLYGNLSHLAPRKRSDPDMQIAVGGCLAQKDRDAVLDKAPWVDVVFGTHNIGSLPTLLDRARHNRVAQVEIAEALQEFPSSLPATRESGYAAWVSISVGCNNSCTFCIVPSLRGREVDRSPDDILAEVQALVDGGVLEVTLLGQNVNAYGVSFADPRLSRDRGAFAELLRACGRIDGLERVRFTSPHPAEFTDDVIEAMAATPTVCPALHMPLQSGSDRMLRAMRRSYRAERYLGILDRVRAAMPHAAITTDVIVGFPGETEEDFAATLDVVRQARFASAFTFQYSKRPGTPAAELAGQLPKAVVQERYQRLVALQDQIAWEENRAQVGRAVELLVAVGEGRKDARTARMSGRARDGRLVHFTPGEPQIRPGDVVTTVITDAAPHHLIADGAILSHRRTRAGDAHAARQGREQVGLGIPGVGRPAVETSGCSV